MRPSGRAIAAVAMVVVSAVAYRAAFPDRTDYAGHFLAGAGGTLLLLAVVLALPGPVAPAWRVVAAVTVAVLLGVGTEATVFRLAEFDPVDLANQSLGALVAAAGFVDARRWGDPALAAVASLALLVAGFHYAFA